MYDYNWSGPKDIYEAIQRRNKEFIQEYVKSHKKPLNLDILRTALKEKLEKNLIISLTKKGVIMEEQKKDEIPLLYLACEKNLDVDIIRLLLDLGFDPNEKSIYTKQTPLHLSCENKNSLSTIQLLVERGAQTNKVDLKEYIPLFYALENSDLNVIKFLLQNSDFSSYKKPKNMNFLHFVLCKPDARLDVVEYLLSYGVNPNEQDLDLRTPLHYACANKCQTSILDLLIKKSENFPKISLKTFGNIDHQKNLESTENIHQQDTPIKIVNVLDIHKQTPLHELCVLNYTEDRINVLLKAGADPNIQNPKGKTPFHLICELNPSLNLVKMFLESGASVDIQDLEGKTPLYAAIEQDATYDVIYELISKASNFEISDKTTNVTLLHLAFKKSLDLELIKIILERGAKINAQDSSKKTPLHYCTEKNKRQEIGKILLEIQKEKLNSGNLDDNTTSLNLFCEFSTDAETIKTLINKGADPLASDSEGQTPLHFACINHPTFEVVDILLRAGADPKSKNRRRQLPLHLALEAKAEQNVLEMLIKFLGSKEILSLDFKKQTPLEIALRKKYSFSTIKFLIENGAMKENKSGRGGQTPLHIAFLPPIDSKVVKLLLDNGADPDKPNILGKTPLVLAIMNNASQEVLDLVVTQKNFDFPAKSGKTPLFFASSANNIEMMQLLIKKGAQIQVHDKKRKSILHYAILKGANVEVIQLLLDHNADPNEILDNNTTCLDLCFLGKESPSPVVELLLKICKFDSSVQNPFEKAFSLALSHDASFPSLLLLAETGIDLTTFKMERLSFLDSVYIMKNINQIRLALSFDLNLSIDFFYENEKMLICKDFYSIMNDFERILESGDLSDFNIVLSDGSIPVHKFILQNRICLPNEKIAFEKALDIFHSGLCDFQMSEVKPFLRFVYSGYIDHKDKKYEQNILKIGSLFNLEHEWFNEKKGRRGLLKDLKRLWFDDKSKDFAVIVGDENVKLHKLILAIRSELFRGLFLSVDDPSNKVSEYSGRSPQTIKQLLKFFYFDELDFVISSVVASELDEAADFYQTNEKTLTWKILYNAKYL
ncbi:ankyrin repeat-containing [Anaeramoeba ignava]|uniref:Ankyrin repeat-containing n=1 Tax=Anaeramoeba ignava TaxID=1746090 RepID=A0A9Q0LQP0_ANAIG|nr:ankyrin repeat-containing [Anaeramoeba ignava]